MNIVTGYKGAAHITAAQTGAFNAGIVGAGSYVMPTGQRLEATVITNNLVRINDGDIVMMGRHITIANGTYDEVQIANGLQGVKRNDLIVARYTKDANTGIEGASLVVIQGTSTEGTPEDPEYNDNNILDGAIVSDMPLYRLRLDGLNVGEPEKLFQVASSMQEMQNEIGELNSTLADFDALNIVNNELILWGVFSSQVWWGNYMYGFLFHNADQYNWSVKKATLFKGNTETAISTSKFTFGISGNNVRLGCSDSSVAGCMIDITLTVTKK